MMKRWLGSSAYDYDSNAKVRRYERLVLVLAAAATLVVGYWFDS